MGCSGVTIREQLAFAQDLTCSSADASRSQYIHLKTLKFSWTSINHIVLWSLCEERKSPLHAAGGRPSRAHSHWHGIRGPWEPIVTKPQITGMITKLCKAAKRLIYWSEQGQPVRTEASREQATEGKQCVLAEYQPRILEAWLFGSLVYKKLYS